MTRRPKRPSRRQRTLTEFGERLSTISPIRHYYTLCEKKVEGATHFAWVRNDGELLSPLFRTKECAREYSERMPIMTDREWRTYGKT